VNVLGLSSLRPGRIVVPLPESEPFLSGPSGCKLHVSRLDRTDIVSVAGVLAPLNNAAVEAVSTTLSLVARLRRPTDDVGERGTIPLPVRPGRPDAA